MEQEKKALRYNKGKLDWTLLDWQSIKPLVEGMTYGATVYERDNWKNKCDDPMQHIQSAFRHLIAIASGEEIDPESGVRHSGHVMCNMMMYNYHTMPKSEEPKLITTKISENFNSKWIESPQHDNTK